MYRKDSEGWLKHADFIILDMICLQLAYVLAYAISGYGFNPYETIIYRNMAVFLELADLVMIFAYGTMRSVLKRGYYRDFVVTLNHAINIVCTGFINRKMPLIRYKVDDKAIPYKDGYKIVGHRENEVLYGKNDYTISATTIEFTHEDCFEKIDSYQFEQNEIGKVEMRLKTDVKLSDIEMKKIYNRVKEKLPYFELKLVVVDELEKTKRGKYKMIIQNCKNDWGGQNVSSGN